MGEIEGLLPHREPFLFVDAIDEATERRVVARRTFAQRDFFFAGHFPGYPVVPGVILIEALAQAGGAGMLKAGAIGRGSLFFLASVDKVRLRRQVRPGEEVRLEVESLRVTPRSLRQAGRAWVGGQLAAEAEWMCLVGPGPAGEGGRS